MKKSNDGAVRKTMNQIVNHKLHYDHYFVYKCLEINQFCNFTVYYESQHPTMNFLLLLCSQ